MKAIETKYNGRLYRSRLEARWAVFFDTAGIRVEYEAEGYRLPGGVLYLPDFRVPSLNAFIEIKPGELNDTEARKCGLLAVESVGRVYAFCGQVEPTTEWGNPPRAVAFIGYPEGFVEDEDGWAWAVCGACGPVIAWQGQECPQCGSEVDENSILLLRAYQAAASARFEFGARAS